ncbi:hypothetical protein CXB51_002337 [Gossypium anomalum]|uniref:Uncharacterized protein n=1 Tax=Gossypium anomalum TaxID=47600 RepID=A0A8J6DFA5_9ROSI|nr:hypothetical protein CXB51_002337 [Gossypium anomalum]
MTVNFGSLRYLPPRTPSKFNPHLHQHHLPFTCMDDLAPRFAALSLPKHHQKLPKVTNFQRLKEPSYFSVLVTCTVIMGLRATLKPGLGLCKGNNKTRLFQNRGLPFEANGFNNYKLGLGGGLVRESGGTGVFHPPIVNTPFDSTKKQSMRNRQTTRDDEVHEKSWCCETRGLLLSFFSTRHGVSQGLDL